MLEYSQMEVWWHQVPGATRLLQKVLQQLANRRNVWISGYLPWSDTFREIIISKLAESNRDLRVEIRSAIDLIDTSSEDLVFSLFPGARSRYMPGKELATYINEQRLLEDTIIWIYDLNQERDNRWLTFSQQLGTIGAGLKVLCEGISIQPTISARRSKITMVLTEGQYTSFDKVLFAMFLVSTLNQSDGIKRYCSYLASELVGGEVEMITCAIKNAQQLYMSPNEVANMLGISDNSFIQNRIHRVQVKVLLPEIEEQFEALVERNSDNISKILPFEDDYGSERRELYDLELRHVRHFKNQGDITLDVSDSKRLDFLYECRNLIAHHIVIDGERIERIFDMK